MSSFAQRGFIAVLAASFALSHAMAAEQVFFGTSTVTPPRATTAARPRRRTLMLRIGRTSIPLLLSEHNHSQAGPISKQPSLYEDVNNPSSSIAAAKRATEDGVFVALYDQEFSTHARAITSTSSSPQGHSGVAQWRFDQLLEWLAEPDHRDSSNRIVLIQLSHPWAEPASEEYVNSPEESTIQLCPRRGSLRDAYLIPDPVASLSVKTSGIVTSA